MRISQLVPLMGVIAIVNPLGMAMVETTLPPANPPPQTDDAQGQPSPRSSLPLGGPIVNATAVLRADRAMAWPQGQARCLLLERRVTISVGSYGFQANRAVVRIDTEHQAGTRVHHLAVYLDHAEPLHGNGPVQVQAQRLLVTASTRGGVQLTTDLLQHAPDTVQDRFVQYGLARIDRHIETVSAPPLVDVPPGQRLFGPQTQALRQTRRQQITQEALRRSRLSLAAASSAPARQPDPATQTALLSRQIMGPGGTVSFHADKIVLQKSKPESSLVLLGNVRLVYQHPSRGQAMSLKAENAVVFLASKAMARLAGRSADAGDVRGVYLEDNVVATDGQYTVRAPRVYYDLERNKAVVLDAVFYTWDAQRRVPIYVRAQKLRQESLLDWTGHQALLTTSEFAQPHFSIAANRISFQRTTNRHANQGYRFVAKDSTLRWGDLPLFYWPHLAGDVETLQGSPLPRVSIGSSRQDGLVVRTTWDLFAVSGQPQPKGVKLRGRLDALGDRGGATGVDLDYRRPRMFGQLDGYLLIHDTAQDQIGSRQDVAFDGDTRGYSLWRHRQHLRDNWDLSLEFAHVSDPTFLEAFFQDQAELSKPYETSIYLKKQEHQKAFTFLAQHDTMQFTPQVTALQAPGYTVEKLPELGYYHVGVSLWEDRLTYWGETRLSRMRIRAGEDTPDDRGFTPAQSLQLFGIPATTDFEAALGAAGISSGYRLRLDSRHEIQSPLKMGVFDLVPYATGRVTLYDDDFVEFQAEDDPLRLWTTLGLKIHTQLSKVDPTVENKMLDLHRIRHIIEPHIDIFWSGSNLDPEDIPIFDQNVEGLAEGFGVRIGSRNTWQTQRGGDGRWRSVDWLTLNTDLVFRSDDADVNAELARFFSDRPELSRGGDHFHTDMMWMVSDALAAVGDLTYSLEHERVSQWRLGASFQHNPRLSFFTDYSEIDQLASRLLAYGFEYQLTRKYRVQYRHTLDLGGDESRSIEVALERKLPRWRMLVVARIDELDDEQTIGLVLIPEGIRSSRLLQPAGTRRDR